MSCVSASLFSRCHLHQTPASDLLALRPSGARPSVPCWDPQSHRSRQGPHQELPVRPSGTDHCQGDCRVFKPIVLETQPTLLNYITLEALKSHTSCRLMFTTSCKSSVILEGTKMLNMCFWFCFLFFNIGCLEKWTCHHRGADVVLHWRVHRQRRHCRIWCLIFFFSLSLILHM